MPISFERSICCDLNETISREWLVTNGLGGYAAGTVAGTLTRLQHGLLVAPLGEGTTPQLLLAKIDEEIVFDQRTYYLGTNEYRDGTLNPAGFVHLETFRLEQGFPVFTYHLGGIDGIVLEKRIWMPQGLNATYIQYRVLRTAFPQETAYRNASWNSLSRASYNNHGRYHDYPDAAQRVLTIKLLPFAAYRPYNEPQYGNNDWHFQVETHQGEFDAFAGEGNRGIAGCTIRAWDKAHPYHIVAVGHPQSETTFLPTGVWYWHFLRRKDQAAGLPAIDDLYLPGVFRTRLWPGEDAALTIIVTTDDLSWQTFNPGQLTRSYHEAVEYQRGLHQPQRYYGEAGGSVQTLPLLPFAPSNDLPEPEEFLRLLLQAADRFLAQRSLSPSELPDHALSLFKDTEHIPIVVPGYYDMEDCARTTLIALPGLTLATSRYSEAQRILSSLARYFKQGLLPDRLPAHGQPLQDQDYGSVDTTLWYFYALDQYLRATRDYELLDDLYERLVDSISWYFQGTHNGIRVDPQDGLLLAHQPGKALTWMNAYVNHIPVTPRYGKPVEVNALWYNALCLMHEWSQLLYQAGRINHRTTYYAEKSARGKQGFNERFWYPLGGYLYDVIDGPDGNDASIRPNQLLALSLRYPVLDEAHQRAVLNIVTGQLVTSLGLRTLAPQEKGYEGHLKDNLEEQQRTLHQGSAWPWLIGPYLDALLRVEGSAHTTTTRTTADQQACQEKVWRKGLQALGPLRQRFTGDMLGIIAGVYDGDAPHEKTGRLVASALSIAEILRVYKLLVHMGVRYPDRAVPV